VTWLAGVPPPPRACQRHRRQLPAPSHARPVARLPTWPPTRRCRRPRARVGARSTFFFWAARTCQGESATPRLHAARALPVSHPPALSPACPPGRPPAAVNAPALASAPTLLLSSRPARARLVERPPTRSRERRHRRRPRNRVDARSIILALARAGESGRVGDPLPTRPSKPTLARPPCRSLVHVVCLHPTRSPSRSPCRQPAVCDISHTAALIETHVIHSSPFPRRALQSKAITASTPSHMHRALGTRAENPCTQVVHTGLEQTRKEAS